MPSLPTGENSKDIVSKLGNENSLKGAQSCGHDDERRRHRKRKKRERKRGREKNKEPKRNAESSYSYCDWEKSSPRKDERLELLLSGRNLGGRDLPL